VNKGNFTPSHCRDTSPLSGWGNYSPTGKLNWVFVGDKFPLPLREGKRVPFYSGGVTNSPTGEAGLHVVGATFPYVRKLVNLSRIIHGEKSPQ